MRWTVKAGPKYGDTKVKREWTWFPMKFGNTWVWLEKSRITYTYSLHGWQPTRWEMIYE